MKTYSVFEPPVLPGNRQDDALSLVFVRHGWSLAALIIPLVWMAVRRLWWLIAAYLILVIAIQLTALIIPTTLVGALSLATALSIMLEAGQLRLEYMALRGYREVAVLEAPNEREAERLYLAHWIGAQDGVDPSDHPSPGHATVLRPSSAKPPALPGFSS